MNASTEDRTRKAIEILDQTIKRIRNEALSYEQRAHRDRRTYAQSRIVTAFLGVIAPAVVTYQIQNTAFQLLAIVLTGLAGVAATLQATFRWGDSFGRTRLTALALEELWSNTELQKQALVDSDDSIRIYREAYELNDNASSEERRIIRVQIEGEVSMVREPQEQQKTINPPTDKDSKHLHR
jgi:hypothetical protein